jgi:uncharacterized membrane protein
VCSSDLSKPASTAATYRPQQITAILAATATATTAIAISIAVIVTIISIGSIGYKLYVLIYGSAPNCANVQDI